MKERIPAGDPSDAEHRPASIMMDKDSEQS